MKSDDIILIGVALFFFMMMNKAKAQTGSGSANYPSQKPAATGASNTSLGQYWANVLGKNALLNVNTAVSKSPDSSRLYSPWSTTPSDNIFDSGSALDPTSYGDG